MSSIRMIMVMSIFIAFDKVQSIIASTSTADNIENYTNSEYDDMGNNTDYFAKDIINCGTSICNVQCDVDSGCYGLRINALSANTLNVKCNHDLSCYDMYISADSTTSISIVCSGNYSCYHMDVYADLAPSLTLDCNEQRACSNMSISADTAQNINIQCNSNASTLITYEWPHQYGSCYRMSLFAINSGTTNLYCTDYNCAYTHIYLSNAVSAIINMEGYLAASNAYIYTENMQTDLDLICTEHNACYYTSLVAGTMKGDVYVICEGDSNEWPCQETAVLTSDINGSLTVDCVDQYNCNSVQVYCPDECNVNCLAPYTCYHADLYIGNHFNDTINLNCGDNNMSTSCKLVKVKCLDTRGHTIIYFNFTTSEWECDRYGCCPFQIGTIICDAAKPCQVDCTANKCAGYYIDGRSATSLNVNCTGTSGCEASKIDCPVGDGASCFINCYDSWSCAYAVVETGNSQMDEFKLYCPGSCAAMDVSLHSTISTVNISCTSCSFMKIRATSIIYNVEIDCSSFACQDTDFQFSTADIVTLRCGEGGCSGANFEGITDTLIVHCKEFSSCNYITFDYAIGNDNFVLDCSGSESCEFANINLTSTKPDTNIVINCINKLTTTTAHYGTCNNAHFNIYGYHGNNALNNNLSLQCGQYDCYGIDFHGYNIYIVDVACNDPYSCQKMYLDADSSQYLSLNCNDSYACNEATVYCAYKDIGSCDIDCSSIGFTCSDMQIYVPDSYVYDYLDLNCQSVVFTKNGTEYDSAYTCSNLMVKCNTGNRLDIEYLYNKSIDDYECSSAGNTFCCPYYQGPTINPTETPTPNPSSAPTETYIDGTNQSGGGVHSFISFLLIIITI